MFELRELHIAGWERIFAFELSLADTIVPGVIAIHNTTLGPGLGGVRVDRYATGETMLADAMNLARQMSFKAAAAGLPFGGAKAVLNTSFDPRTDPDFLAGKAPFARALFDAFGKVVTQVNHNGLKYITAPDVNTNVAHMARIHRATEFVSCLPEKIGIGDPSPYTAQGVYYSILAALKFYRHVQHGTSKAILNGVNVLLQGYGKVGHELARMVRDAGAYVSIVDSSAHAAAAAQEAGFTVFASLQEVTGMYLLFAPCATGQMIRPEPDSKGFDSIDYVEKLGVRIICGSANNQLVEELRTAKKLYHRGILYIPDFVCNAGGLAAAGAEWLARTGKIRKKTMQEKIRTNVRRIGRRVGEICEYARARDDSTLEAAHQLARLNVRQKGGELW